MDAPSRPRPAGRAGQPRGGSLAAVAVVALTVAALVIVTALAVLDPGQSAWLLRRVVLVVAAAMFVLAGIGLDRWVLAPMTVTISAAGLAILLQALPLLTPQWGQAVLVAEALGMLAVPTALVAATIRQRLARAAVADIVVDVARPNPDQSVTDGLRTALHDPTLQVLFWVEDTQCYIDETGHPATEPTRERMVIPLDVSGDSQDSLTTPPARAPGWRQDVVVGHPTLARHRQLITAAVQASGLALRNARLRAELRAQLDQVHASRRRIAEAGVAERRRIERDLHDGLQQRLLALTLTVAQVRATTDDPAVLRVVETVRTEIHTALRELRDVVHGVLPAMLAQGGLQPALEDVTDRLPLTVHLDIAPGRWPSAVETTAYFIVCEALANIANHADADHATVQITTTGTDLHLDVTDHGRGGADLRRGIGLAGLGDRARAIDGTLTVHTSPQGGTHLTVVLPCG